VNVMFAAKAGNHDACSEKEEGFEKGMGHKMEDRCRPCADTEGQEHVADLADCGVGEDPFDVRLRERASRGKKQGGGTDDSYEPLDERGQLEDDVHPGDEINPGRYHGRRVNEGGDRRGAGHGIGEPRLERKLGGLADGSPEKQEGRPEGYVRALSPLPGRCPEHALYAQCAEVDEKKQETDGKGRVADAGDDECLIRCRYISRVIIPEADKEITAQPNAFPSEIEKEQVICHDQDQHGTHKKIHVRKEAPDARLPSHVFRRVKQYKESDDGNNENHDNRQGVNVKRDKRRKAVDCEPRPEGLRIGISGWRRDYKIDCRKNSRDCGESHGTGANGRYYAPRQQGTRKYQDDETCKREGDNQTDKLKHLNLSSCWHSPHRASCARNTCRESGQVREIPLPPRRPG